MQILIAWVHVNKPKITWQNPQIPSRFLKSQDLGGKSRGVETLAGNAPSRSAHQRSDADNVPGAFVPYTLMTDRDAAWSMLQPRARTADDWQSESNQDWFAAESHKAQLLHRVDRTDKWSIDSRSVRCGVYARPDMAQWVLERRGRCLHAGLERNFAHSKSTANSVVNLLQIICWVPSSSTLNIIFPTLRFFSLPLKSSPSKTSREDLKMCRVGRLHIQLHSPYT